MKNKTTTLIEGKEGHTEKKGVASRGPRVQSPQLKEDRRGSKGHLGLILEEKGAE